MNRPLVLAIGLMAVCIFGFITMNPQRLFAEGASFGGVYPFATPSGNIGFFDQSNGKIYVYDGTMQKCLYIAKMESLGKPVKKIEDKVNAPEVTGAAATYQNSDDLKYQDTRKDWTYHDPAQNQETQKDQDNP